MSEAPRRARLMRLRVKVWTDPESGKRFLAAGGVFAPAKDQVLFFAMSDEETKHVKVDSQSWNDLPYFWFEEDGESEKPPEKWPRHTAPKYPNY